jgi:hypothetical protein
VADLLAGGGVVSAEYAADARPLPSGLQLWVAERRRDPPLIEREPSVMRLLPWRLEWRPNAAVAVFVSLLAAPAFLNLHHISEFLYFGY